MDQTTFIDVKNNSKYTVHRLLKKIPQPNATYGLWIISFRKQNISPRRNKIIPHYFEFYGLTHLTKGIGWYWNKDSQRKTIAIDLSTLQEWLRNTIAGIIQYDKYPILVCYQSINI